MDEHRGSDQELGEEPRDAVRKVQDGRARHERQRRSHVELDAAIALDDTEARDSVNSVAKQEYCPRDSVRFVAAKANREQYQTGPSAGEERRADGHGDGTS